jgi:peptidoglycan/xylan/chitin deacetylase (PgdA/CDA1 family)
MDRDSRPGTWRRAKIFAFFAVPALIMLVGMPRGVAAPGALVNSSLESDADADGVPDCFTPGGFGSNTATFTRAGAAHTGAWSERLEITAYSDGDRKLVPTMTSGCAPGAVAGERYTVSVWFNSTVPVALVMYALGPSGWGYWFDGPVQPPSPTYRQLNQDVPAIPAGVTAVSFGLSISAVGQVVTDDYGITTTPTTTTTTAPPGPCSAGYVALSYDDGPGPLTATLLDTLKTKHARATFFIVGDQISTSTAPLVTREAREGHVQGNHTWSHPHLLALTDSQIRSELTRTTNRMVQLGARRPTLWRPPYSETNDHIDALAAGLSLTKTLFAVDTGDADEPGASAEEITTRAVSRAQAGYIVIMHDLQPNAVTATPDIIDGLRARGFCLGVIERSSQYNPPNQSYVQVIP